MTYRALRKFLSGLKKNSSGFTLVELLIYAVIFTIASGLLTGILVTISNVQTKENAAFEVTRQLQFVTQRVQYAIRDASLIDAVYEGATPATPCATFCTVKLRVTDPALDPTVITSDVNGVYVTEGTNPRVTLTSPNVKITSLKFGKVDNPGGITTVSMDISLIYNSGDTGLQIVRSLNSAIAHVSAANFDMDLLPDSTDQRSIGISSLRWKDITISNGMTVAGNALGGSFPGLTMSNNGGTYGISSINEYYVTSTPYNKYGAQFDVGSTPMLYLEGDIGQSGRRAYFLNGNVGIGTSSPGATLSLNDAVNNNSLIISPAGNNQEYFAISDSGGYPIINFFAKQNGDSNWVYTHATLNASQIRQGGAGEMNFLTSNNANTGVGSNATFSTKLTILNNGNIGIGTATPGSYKLYVNGGDAYFSGDVSAQSFTDRTPYPENIGIAYDAVMSMQRLSDGEYQPGNKEHQLDHSTLTEFVRGNNGDRDLSATVSAQNEVIKDLIKRIERLEKE